MPIDYNKIKVHIDLEAIRDNYRVMCRAGTRVAAVVKADAYGHGLAEVSRALEDCGAEVFAVGTVEEAAKLRASGCRGTIIALLGHMDKADLPLLWSEAVMPFVAGFEQLRELAEASRNNGPLDICLKFDTGMARLGFGEDDVEALAAILKDAQGLNPALAASHFATADEPGQFDFAAGQQEIFKNILRKLEAAGLPVQGSLANSAGILAHEGAHHGLQRAGIALYGDNPFQGTDMEDLGAGLRPAMSVSAPVVQVRELKKGQSISYGRTFTTPRDMHVAVVGAGYADCFSRGLSNKGRMNVNGHRAPIVGRVCMQLTAVDVTGVPRGSVSPGDEAWILGGPGDDPVTPRELAEWWGTITYEVFCLLGMNRRRYV